MQFDRDVVEDDRMDAFRSAHVIQRDVDAAASDLTKLASAESGDADRVQTIVIGPGDRLDDIRAVAGAGDGDDQIAASSERLKLLLENCVIAVIVTIGCHERNVVRQRDRPESLGLIDIVERPFGKVIGKMRGIGSAATVANDKNSTLMLIGVFQQGKKFTHL